MAEPDDLGGLFQAYYDCDSATWFSGQGGDGLAVGLEISVVFSNFNDFMIL